MTLILLFSGWAAILVTGVPEQDLSVGAGRNEGIAAGAEVDPPGSVTITAQSEDLMAGGDVQDPDDAVPARGRQPAAVRAECDAFDYLRGDACSTLIASHEGLAVQWVQVLLGNEELVDARRCGPY
jgi:hypothetical protein